MTTKADTEEHQFANSTPPQMAKQKVRDNRFYFFIVLAILLLVTTIAGFMTFVKLRHYENDLTSKLEQLSEEFAKLQLSMTGCNRNEN